MSVTTRSITVLAVGLFLAGPGAALTGCNLIVGSGDYVIGGEAGAGTADDASSSNPPDGSGGSSSGGTGSDGATSLPEAGPTPEAGSGGDGGVPADGGTPPVEAGPPVITTVGCDSRGNLVTGSQETSASFQQIVNACTLAVSCDEEFFEVTVSDCITRNYLGTFPAASCLASVQSCDDYYACTHYGILDDLAACDGSNSSDTGKCTGTVATTCFGGIASGFEADCSMIGGTCVVYSESGPATAANCEQTSSCSGVASGEQCASSTETVACDRDTDTPIGQHCPASTACVVDDNSGHCSYAASSCTTVGASCSGNNLVLCAASQSGGNEGGTFDCGAVGLYCVADAGNGSPGCAAPGCATSGCVEGCNADGTITACVGGAPLIVDCTQIGFQDCGSDTPTGSNTTYAFCVNDF